MLNPQDHSLPKGLDSSAKSIANTGFNTDTSYKLGRKLVQELIDSGIPVHNQNFLNYRNVSKEQAFELIGMKLSGWVVLYMDINGKPFLHDGQPFYRLKPDAGQLTGHDAPKYLTKKGAGNRPYFSPFLEAKHISEVRDVIITEGEKKTDCLTLHGFPTIGLAGVWSWKDRRSEGMLPELEKINWRGRNAFIVFDSDVVTKDSVKRALKELSTVLTLKGANVRVTTLPCDLDGTKNGADDFIVKYGKEALSHLLLISRNSHKNRKFIWNEEPIKSHHVAVIASSVFSSLYATRPVLGLYRWVGTRWEHLKEKPITAIDVPLHKWLDHMGWERRESGFLKSVKEELLVRLKAEKWNPSHLMSFKNGTFNVNTQKFIRSHDRRDYLTHAFDFKYDEDAKCPKWESFLNEIFSNNQELINLLKAAFKWSISPKDTTRPFLIELFFDLNGRRGSGKGTTLEVLMAVAGGKEAYGIFRTSSLSNLNARFGLIGKKIAIDPDASGHISDAGVFNSITTNEPVEVEKKYVDRGFERLGVVIWRSFNDNPSASGGGVEGIGRRMVTFKFTKVAANPDLQLKNKLFEEVEGIFQWCWNLDDNEMMQILKNRGNIDAVTEASIENQLENQPVLQFIFELADSDSILKIKATDLYLRFKTWCDDTGKGKLSQTKFGRELSKMDGLVSKKPKMDGFEYSISPKTKFDFARYFGITNNEQLNPPSLKVASPNPPSSNPPSGGENKKSMDSMDSSINKNSSKNKKDYINKKEFSQQTLQTLQPSINGSAWDTESDEDDPYWG